MGVGPREPAAHITCNADHTGCLIRRGLFASWIVRVRLDANALSERVLLWPDALGCGLTDNDDGRARAGLFVSKFSSSNQSDAKHREVFRRNGGGPRVNAVRL